LAINVNGRYPQLPSSLLDLQGKRPFLNQILPVIFILLLLYPITLALTDARGLLERSKPSDQYADAAI